MMKTAHASLLLGLVCAVGMGSALANGIRITANPQPTLSQTTVTYTQAPAMTLELAHLKQQISQAEAIAKITHRPQDRAYAQALRSKLVSRNVASSAQTTMTMRTVSYDLSSGAPVYRRSFANAAAQQLASR